MKTAIIINPQAGQGRCVRRWRALQGSLRDVVGPMKYCPTESPGHATQLTQALLRDGYTHLISAGGDGTHFEVINGWFSAGVPINRDARLTILPMGTGSDLARTLGVGPGRKGIEALKDAVVLSADVGCIQCRPPHGEGMHTYYFLNMARVGIGATACRYVNEHSKAIGGFLSYLRAILRCLLTYRDQRLQIRLDGRIAVEGLTKDFSVAKGCFDAGGMRMAPHARLDNGHFDCYHIGPVGFFDALRSLPKLYAGRLSERRDLVRYLRGSSIEVTTPGSVEIEADGEFIGYAPAIFTLLPGSVNLTAARPSAD